MIALILQDIRSKVRIYHRLLQLRQLARSRLSCDVLCPAGAVLALEPLLRIDDVELTRTENGVKVAPVAMDILGILPLRDCDSRNLLGEDFSSTASCIAWLLMSGYSYDRMSAAVPVMRLSASTSDRSKALLACAPGLMEGLSNVSIHGTGVRELRAALKALKALCSGCATSQARRRRVVEAGAIPPLIYLLSHPMESICKRAMGVVTLLCAVQQGRDAVAKHAIGVRSVCRLLLTVSPPVTRYAVTALWLLSACATSANTTTRELVECRAAEKWLLVLQSACSSNTKRMVSDIFRSNSLYEEINICFHRASLEATVRRR